MRFGRRLVAGVLCASLLLLLVPTLAEAASHAGRPTAAATAAKVKPKPAASMPAAARTRATPAAVSAAGPAAVQQCGKQHAVFSNPWVRQHVALTYAPETTRDGLGAQAVRLLGIYALAKCTQLQYVHTGVECVGHIGGLAHYQGRECESRMTRADQRQLARVQAMLSLLPTQAAAAANTSAWHVARLDDVTLTWQHLAAAAQAALQSKRPTVIKLARVQALLCQHPDVFLALPELRPQKVARPRPLWLNSVRVTVHMRRGDITHNAHHLHRVLPVSYYTNVIATLSRELQAAGRDAAVEVFTERPRSAHARKELRALRASTPGLVLHVGTDDVWNWHQMAAADVLVLSLSMYGAVPSLLNPSALVISPAAPPAALDGKRMSVLRMPHWFSAVDRSGTLPAAALAAVRARWGGDGRKPQPASARRPRPTA